MRLAIKYMILEYTQPIFSLSSIDQSDDIEENVVYFTDTKTNKNLTQNLQDLYHNKELLRYFKSTDAAKIGYHYGKWIARQRKL